MLLSFNFSLSLLCGFCVLCTCRVSYLEQDGKPVPAALGGPWSQGVGGGCSSTRGRRVAVSARRLRLVA